MRSFYAAFVFFFFCGVQKQNGKLIIRKIEIKHVWHIESSVDQKQNRVNFNNADCN